MRLGLPRDPGERGGPAWLAFRTTAASVGERKHTPGPASEHAAGRVLGCVCVLCATSQDPRSLQKHVRDRAEEEPSCRIYGTGAVEGGGLSLWTTEACS